MEIKLIELVSQGGWIALGALIIYMFINLEKKVDKLSVAITTLNDSMQLKKDKSECVICRSESKNELKDIRDKVEDLQAETITREEHYRDISGWRMEFSKLTEKIDNWRGNNNAT